MGKKTGLNKPIKLYKDACKFLGLNKLVNDGTYIVSVDEDNIVKTSFDIKDHGKKD